MTEKKKEGRRSVSVMVSKHVRLGKYGTGLGEFNDPAGIAIGSNGMIYICDHKNHRIQVFDVDGKATGHWGSQGVEEGKFLFPIALAIEKIEWISSSLLCNMMRVDVLAAFPPGLLPIIVSYTNLERIYVADTANSRIQVFEENGLFVRMWGQRGSAPGQFIEGPTACTVSSEATVYVAEHGHTQIQAFQTDGTVLFSWKCTFPLARRRCIAMGRDGILYAVGRKPRGEYLLCGFSKDGDPVKIRVPESLEDIYGREGMPLLGDVVNGIIWYARADYLDRYNVDGTHLKTYEIPANSNFKWDLACSTGTLPMLYVTNDHSNTLAMMQLAL